MCELCEIYHTEAIKKRTDGRYLLRQEIRLRNRIEKSVFAKQLKFVLKETEKFWIYTDSAKLTEATQKELLDKINALVEKIPEKDTMAELLNTQMELLLMRGSKRIIKKLNLGKFGIKFDLKNKGAIKYLKDKKDFELSNKKGNIHYTTKMRIKDILIKGANEGTAYTELAKEIQGQAKAGVFSRSRSQLIATRELGQAYEAGNNLPVAEFVKENNDRPVEKFWQTVGDDRVTETHKANQSAGWIDFKKRFQGTGDLHAPGSDNPRCRCFTKYKILPPKKKK